MPSNPKLDPAKVIRILCCICAIFFCSLPVSQRPCRCCFGCTAPGLGTGVSRPASEVRKCMGHYARCDHPPSAHRSRCEALLDQLLLETRPIAQLELSLQRHIGSAPPAYCCSKRPVYRRRYKSTSACVQAHVRAAVGSERPTDCAGVVLVSQRNCQR